MLKRVWRWLTGGLNDPVQERASMVPCGCLVFLGTIVIGIAIWVAVQSLR